ncbi:ATP-binding cassette domain-containing protein [Escherichia coli]|uniref:ATP-binding cassette domain-containing protein n=1 Tax=Escherichia coli TaxID=562 RepID=UPI0030D45A2F
MVKAVHGIDLDINDGEFMVCWTIWVYQINYITHDYGVLKTYQVVKFTVATALLIPFRLKIAALQWCSRTMRCIPIRLYLTIWLWFKNAKRPKEEIKKIVEEVAEKLEISDLLYRKPKNVSGGQRQRVAVGRAIVRKPDVFLFDEPLSNLDAKHYVFQCSQNCSVASSLSRMRVIQQP